MCVCVTVCARVCALACGEVEDGGGVSCGTSRAGSLSCLGELCMCAGCHCAPIMV